METTLTSALAYDYNAGESHRRKREADSAGARVTMARSGDIVGSSVFPSGGGNHVIAASPGCGRSS